jgi:hypothetical protein
LTINELKKHFNKGRANAYAWPGGYPLFYLTSDGECLCPTCVTKERVNIFRSTAERARDGWAVVGVDANYEDVSMRCAHCNEYIPAAYFTDEEADAERAREAR